MFQRRIVVLLLAVLLAIPGLFTNAQTPTANGIPSLDELTGIQASVFRSYGHTGTFFGQATMSLDDATPASSVAGRIMLASLSVTVHEFDTAEHAASAFERLSAGADASLSNVFPGGEVTSKDLPSVGSQATLIRMDYIGPGSEVWYEYVFVQWDQYVIFVSADGSVFSMTPGIEDVDKSLPTVEIATAIATNGEPSPDETVFMEDGTSTGGLWGFMLPAHDPLLKGLVPVYDSIFYPTPRA